MKGIKIALKCLPEYEALTKEDILRLLDKIDGESYFPVVIPADNSYVLGFMENDAYTEYLGCQAEADRQISEIANDWELINDTCLYAFDTSMYYFPKEMGDFYWLEFQEE